MRIDEEVLYQASLRSQQIALRNEGSAITYAELARQIGEIKDSIFQRGLMPGERVALCLPNRLDYLVWFLGIIHAGLVASPINPRLIDSERRQMLKALRPVLIIEEKAGVLSWKKKPDHKDAYDGEDDLFYIGYTSGTTGIPKGIRRTHKSWVDSFFAMSKEFGMDDASVLLLPGPLYYSGSLIAGLHGLFIGATVEVHETFDPRRVCQRLTESDVNTLYMVPTMYRDVVNAQGEKPNQHTITMITAGDKMAVTTKEKLMAVFPNAALYEYYGTSEVGFVSLLSPSDQLRKPESVGKPFYKAEVRCIDDEIQVRSTMGFSGYDGPDATLHFEKLLREDGFLATSDWGYIDDEGYLYVTGRQHDKMVVGGVNIYPREMETVMERHPNIKEVAVLAMPDERLGEVPVAFIVMVDRHGSAKEIDEYIKTHLSGYKRPRFWWQIESLPRNATGKVLKSALLHEILQKSKLD